MNDNLQEMIDYSKQFKENLENTPIAPENKVGTEILIEQLKSAINTFTEELERQQKNNSR
jgi:hypothetical protein